jgi:hypothetical protein
MATVEELQAIKDLNELQYNKPTFTLSFSSSYGQGNLEFVEGILVDSYISPDLKELMNRNEYTHYVTGYQDLEVTTSEANYLIQMMSSRTFNIKQIYDFIDFRYEFYQNKTSRPKRVKATDSAYLGIKRSLGPIYQNIYSEYQNSIKALSEVVTDTQNNAILQDEIAEIEAVNGPNLAEIENDRFRKKMTELFLYGVPFIVALVLIIKKWKQ